MNGAFRSLFLNLRLFSSLFFFAPTSQLPFLISFLSAILPSTFDYLGVVAGFSQRWIFTWRAFRTTAFIIWIVFWAALVFWWWRGCWVQGILFRLSTLFLSLFLFLSFVFVYSFGWLLFGLLFLFTWILWLCSNWPVFAIFWLGKIVIFFTIVRYALRHLCLNLVSLHAMSLSFNFSWELGRIIVVLDWWSLDDVTFGAEGLWFEIIVMNWRQRGVCASVFSVRCALSVTTL